MTRRADPPAATRFQKGRSGNPKGRPRKLAVPVPPASVFDIIIDKTLSLTRNGVAEEVRVEEALQHKTYQDAIGGSRMAAREILKMIQKRERARARKTGPVRNNIELVFEQDPDNANAAMMILGIAGKDERYSESDRQERLLLEPWAVEAALSRRRGRSISRKDLAEIERSTRAVDTVVWSGRVGE